jgi:dihydrofolate synthase/folylpolyglutamate synthase
MTYQDALDLIFRSFIAAKPFIQGKYDRDVRRPELLLNVAENLGIIPEPEKVLKVTGSKGKGTVARLCAHGLQGHGKVGLIVSPEELDHTDRMSINGQVISKERFVSCFEKIWVAVKEPSAPDYLSPYGLFLLIALQWFKEEGITHYVIETGRGVRYDEGGQIPAHTSVVTSVFLEHAGYLGPSLEEIREDKLSISETSIHTIVGENKAYKTVERPNWYVQCQHLAQQALEVFTGQKLSLPDGPCASFGTKADDQGRQWFYEGLISRESADGRFLKGLIEKHGNDLLFLLSLPDDKDVNGITHLLETMGGRMQHVILTGERGVLSYEQARSLSVTYEGAYDDSAAFREKLDIGVAKVIYFIGTQTFLRLVKQAFFK